MLSSHMKQVTERARTKRNESFERAHRKKKKINYFFQILPTTSTSGSHPEGAAVAGCCHACSCKQRLVCCQSGLLLKAQILLVFHNVQALCVSVCVCVCSVSTKALMPSSLLCCDMSAPKKSMMCLCMWCQGHRQPYQSE